MNIAETSTGLEYNSRGPRSDTVIVSSLSQSCSATFTRRIAVQQTAWDQGVLQT